MTLNCQYERAAAEDQDERLEELFESDVVPRHSRIRRRVGICSMLLIFIVLMIGAFQLGKASTKEASGRAIDFEIHSHTFRYNRSFSEAPDNHTNRAWRELFPQQGGFFVHPTIAPERATFHVFHTLHCLNHIRQSYWLNQRAASNHSRLTDDDLPEDFKQSHVRHCVDLIRQSLMCQADTTLEVVDTEINGVHGFRTEHQCRNWTELRDWTTEQQLRQKVPQIE